MPPAPLATTPAPASSAADVAVEEVPSLYVRGYDGSGPNGTIGPVEVKAATKNLGDDVYARYLAGRLSKREAYAMAKDFVRAHLDLGLRPIEIRFMCKTLFRN